jgi:hypothetical protein
VVTSACAQQIQPAPLRDPYAYAAHVENGAIRAGAELFDNAQKCNRTFGENISRDFTPVQVVIENGANDKYVVDRSHATLECATGTTLRAVGSAAVYQEYRTSLFGVGFVGRHAEGAAADDNDTKRALWADVEFPAQVIVAPHERVGGFLYFQGKCPGLIRRTMTVRLTADNLRSEESVPIEIAIR